MKKCLFLDRDGIINEDIAYAHKPEQIVFVPGIFQVCRLMQKRGFMIVIVTNQSGIARGYYDEAEFAQLTRWMNQQFIRRGIHISAVYHCPHHPKISGPCHCRKPNPGMLQQAIKRFNIDPNQSYMIGDKMSDMQAALAAGIKHRILLQSQHNLIKRSFLYTIRVQYHSQLLRILRR